MRVVNYVEATSQVAETAVRAVFKEHTRDEVLFERGKIMEILQKTIDDATATFGVRVSAVEVEVSEVPDQVVRVSVDLGPARSSSRGKAQLDDEEERR